MTEPLGEHPRTVVDPLAWIRFGLTHLTAAGGGYAIALTLGLAVLAGRLGAIGGFGIVAVPAGLAIGAALGLVVGTLDGYLVGRVGQRRLRVATSGLNAVVTALVMVLIGVAAGAGGWLAALALYVGPAVTVGVVTWRRSPEARRIHG